MRKFLSHISNLHIAIYIGINFSIDYKICCDALINMYQFSLSIPPSSCMLPIPFYDTWFIRKHNKGFVTNLHV